ncbi:hypothetical protein LWM68_15760 [Niabella sp. W65]|nr:hypothetical protein [Niabella sp. W65]MCH7364082.1 hypothetical protein [Niabella sp. W65]
MYKLAYLNLDGTSAFHNKRIIFTGISETIANYTTKENLFSFDLITAGSDELLSLEKMRKMLDVEFGVTSSIENRLIECLVLKSSSNVSVSPLTSRAESIETPDSVIKKNVPLRNLLMQWNGNIPLLQWPIVNETGLDEKQKINITLPKNTERLESVIAAFNTNGFILSRNYGKCLL